MRYIFTLITLTILSVKGFGFAHFIYVEVKPISCQGNTYDIIIHYTLNTASDIILGSDPEINFGDGNIKRFELYSDYVLINDNQRYYQHTFRHTYPIPGSYKISVRIFNRQANIANMTNSINTPLYFQNQFILDPIIGCNSTPHIENITFPISKFEDSYEFDFSVFDLENDSVSFALTVAKQDEEIATLNYFIPTEYEESNTRKISKITIDPFSGYHFWSTKHTKGNYCIVIKMEEWRKIEGDYYKISESYIDYTTLLYETINNAPEITNLQDTAIVIGENYINDIKLYDPEGDSLQMLVYGDFVQLFKNLPKNEYTYHYGPQNYSISFQPPPEDVRSKPYKLLISGTDKNEDQSLNKTRSMHVWITDREHQPDPPKNMLAQALNQYQIGVYWNDTDDELGYILERSDSHFPNFVKIAVLPANTTSFYDASIVENNTYHYRIKAVGTKMSDYVIAETTTPEIVTSIIDDFSEHSIQVYPNPTTGHFSIANCQGFRALIVSDITGKKVYYQELENQHFTLVYPNLKPGVYVLNLIAANNSQQVKLEILP